MPPPVNATNCTANVGWPDSSTLGVLGSSSRTGSGGAAARNVMLVV